MLAAKEEGERKRRFSIMYRNCAWPVPDPHYNVAGFKLTIQPNLTGKNQVPRPLKFGFQ